MTNTTQFRKAIEQENAEAVGHDMELVNRAARLSFYDEGWQELQDECTTEAARKAIDQIERRKYRLAEARNNME